MTLEERLRAAVAAAPELPPLTGDVPELRIAATIPAAVLIGITERAEPGVILTVRRDTLRAHAGQIAFPGGRIDPGENPVTAALREAQEELALDPSAATPIATLEEYRTVTGYIVTPVLSIVAPDQPLEPHEHEVADWFEAPLAHLLDTANHQAMNAVFAGRERRYWQIEWNGRRIWGATAAMLVNLSRRLQLA